MHHNESESIKSKEKSQQFAGDNNAGICPEAMECLIKANEGHESSYGDDRWTKEACDLFRELFETDCEVFFVFNGTAGNSLALSSLCQSYHSIVCHEYAHVETHECGAPEFFSNGTKLLLGCGENGKLTTDSIEALVTKRTDIHYPKPRAVSVTQATELGTVYSLKELHEVRVMASRYKLAIHMDGTRLANALASLRVSPAQGTWHTGVDVLVFGGTKNGLPVGDAVIFFQRNYAEEFEYRCKQAGQLASKMRFLAAPWVGILKSGAWLRNAVHANDCAALLEDKISEIPELEIMFPRQVNSLFVKMPVSLMKGLRTRGWHFYTFIGIDGARFMCAWDTTTESISELVADIKDLLVHH